MLGYYKMSLIGTQHQKKEDGVCQDYSDVIELENGWIVAAIADGLGSAKKSDLGSSTAVKTVLSFIAENRPDKWHEESLKSLLLTAFHKAINTIRLISKENQDDLRDYDTTLTALVYNGTNLVFGHVGDGGIISLSSYGEFSVLTHAQKGEAFNETTPLRAGPDNWEFGVSIDDVCAITMMTDGIFDIAYPWILADQEQKIYINYVRPFMDRNILKVSTPADFENAQSEIQDFFSGPYSKQITDDKTIIGIINTSIVPEIRPDNYYVEPDWDALAKEHHNKLYGHSSTDEKDDSQKVAEEQDLNVNPKEEKQNEVNKVTTSQASSTPLPTNSAESNKDTIPQESAVDPSTTEGKKKQSFHERSRALFHSLFKKS